MEGSDELVFLLSASVPGLEGSVAPGVAELPIPEVSEVLVVAEPVPVLGAPTAPLAPVVVSTEPPVAPDVVPVVEPVVEPVAPVVEPVVDPVVSVAPLTAPEELASVVVSAESLRGVEVLPAGSRGMREPLRPWGREELCELESLVPSESSVRVRVVAEPDVPSFELSLVVSVPSVVVPVAEEPTEPVPLVEPATPVSVWAPAPAVPDAPDGGTVP